MPKTLQDKRVAKCLTHYSTDDNKFCKFCNPDNNPEDMPKEFEIKVCDRHKKLLPDISNPQTQIIEIRACKDCQSLSNPEDNQWEKRFDDEFIHYNGEFIEATWKDAVGCVGPVKQFIRRLLSQQAEKQRERENKLKEFAVHKTKCYLAQWLEAGLEDEPAECTCGFSKIIEDLTNNKNA